MFFGDCGDTTTSVQLTIRVNGQPESTHSFTLTPGGQSEWIDFTVG